MFRSPCTRPAMCTTKARASRFAASRYSLPHRDTRSDQEVGSSDRFTVLPMPMAQ